MSSADTRVAAEFITPIPRLDDHVEIGVYRIAQEALANAARHAGARSIVIRLAADDDQTLRLDVRDDGCGFALDARQRRAHLGLVGMRERALALGGRVEVWSEPGQGTVIHLECPLRAGAPATAA
jgi:signal transduction histidine kinase